MKYIVTGLLFFLLIPALVMGQESRTEIDRTDQREIKENVEQERQAGVQAAEQKIFQAGKKGTRDATLLFGQDYLDGTSVVNSSLDPTEDVDYEVADNFWGVNEPINEIVFYGLTLKLDGDWQEQVPDDTEPFIIRFYEYVEDYVDGLEAPQTGTYQVALLDSYGDGWGGTWPPDPDGPFHTLSVFVNGNVVLDEITMPDGSGPIYFSFSANAGDIISTEFTINGSFAGECYYAILDPNDNIIAEEGGTWTNPGQTTPGNIEPGGITGLEPQWNNPLHVQAVTANVESVGPVWGQGYILYKFTAPLDNAVNLSEAWVSAQIDAANGSGTWFMWMNSLEGDGLAFHRLTPAKGAEQQHTREEDYVLPKADRVTGHPASLTSKGSYGLIRDQLDYDLAFELWNTQPLELYEVTFSVQDFDNNPIADATVSVDGQQLTTDGSGQASIQLTDGSYTAITTATDYLEETTAFTVDGNDITVTIQLVDVIETPVNLAIDTEGVDPGEALFSWEMPDVPTETFTENWDGYSDWTTNLSPWTTIDEHGITTWGAGDFDFPIEGDAFAWGIMNPAETDPDITNNHPAYNGSKYLFSVASNPSPPTGEENKWLISPQMEVTQESVLSFAAKSITAGYGLERFKVYVSTSGTDPADFTQISPGNYVEVPTEWEEYSYPLGAHAGQPIHFAVENVSDDSFILFLDAFEVTEVVADRGAELAGRAFKGFNVYLNDMETPVATEIADTEHLFTGLPGGNHTAGVEAVYSSGTSDIVTIDFEIEVDEATLTFVVTDDNADPIEDATIEVGGETLTTDASGTASVDLPPDTYAYTVNATGYDEVSDDVVLGEEGTTENVTMILTTHEITFFVQHEDESPAEGAAILIDGHTMYTDPTGEASISLVPDTYEYTVEKECLLDADGTVQLTEDHTENVTLERLMGDANGDGSLDVNDMIITAQYYTQQDPEGFCFENADMMEDGQISVLDILSIAQEIMSP